jgi:hypothetical protein
MSSTEVELITSVLSATAGNIARTISAPSVLITLDTILVTLRGDREPRPHEDVGLAGSFDSVDVEGVETWSQLDRMRIVELGNGMHQPAQAGRYPSLNRELNLKQLLRLASPFTGG